MARTSKAVTKADDNSLAISTERPDFLGDTARGSESVGIDDLSIPRIDIIQDLSPQRKKTREEYIEGAEEGMIFNTISAALYGKSVQVVPVFFRKEWVIWKDRDSGGGFRGAHPTEAAANEAMMTLDDRDSCEVIDTAQHFVLLLTEDGVEEAVISMSKSKMKASRKLNTLVRMAGGDRFSRVYEFRAAQAESAKGEYFNWDMKALGFVSEPVFRKAERMYEAISAGTVDVNRGGQSPEGGGADSTEY